MKKLLALAILASAGISAQTLWLGSPNVGGRMTIIDGPGNATTWSNAATVSFTVDNVLISQGDHIWISGVQGNPNANGHHLVRNISGNVITLENLDHSDLPAYAGAKVDVDVILPGNQWGYCHKLGSFELNAGPRLWPKSGSDLYNRLFGLGGPGSATGTLSRTSPQYTALISRANIAATLTSPGPCNGNDPATCPKEEALLNGSGAGQTAQGDAALFTALAWALTGDVRYRNTSIYLLKGIERIIAINPTFSAMDLGAAGGGRGEDGEYSAWHPMQWAYAYDLLSSTTVPGVWTSTEKATLRKKLFENQMVDGCVNPLGPLSGAITLEKNSDVAIVADSSIYTVGQWIYVKTRQNTAKISDGTLLNITVTGNTAVATLSRPVSNTYTGSPVRVTGSGVDGLDGIKFAINAAGCDANGNNCPTTIQFTVSGVAAGTYSTPGMELFAVYNISGASGEMFQVKEKLSSTRIKLNARSGYHGINSPWGVADIEFRENTCSVSEMAASHGYSAGYNDRVVRLSLSQIPDATTTTFKANPAWVQNFRNVSLPIIYQLYNEMGDVNAVNFETGDITVERGKYSTLAYNHVGAPGESGVFIARRHGWDGSSWSLQALVQTGTLHNLFVSKSAPQITELLAFAHESAIARANIELYWNYFYDTDLQTMKESMTGLTIGGSTSGYAGERLGHFPARMAGALITAITPVIDLVTNQEWLNQLGCFMPYASIPWANKFEKPYHISAADSGSDYHYENDDWAVLAFNSHYNAGTDCQKWGYNFLGGNGIQFYTRDLGTTLGSENIVDLLTYVSEDTPTADYTQAPLSYFFNRTDHPSNPSKKYKALSSRTSWTDTAASLWWLNMQDASVDHMGTYNLPGSYQLHKNTALILPGVRAGTTGNDARFQNGLRFIRVPVSTLGGADNELLTFDVKLVDPAPAGGVKVDLATDSPFLVPPTSIVIPQGSQQITIPVLAYQTTPTSLAHLTATSSNAVDFFARAGNLSGAWESPNTQAISRIDCYTYLAALTSTATVSSANGGSPIRCTITLVAAAGSQGTAVNLSTNLANTSVPSSIRIRNGKTKGSFFVTLQAAASGSLVITASSLGSIQSSAIAVTPSATPGTATIAAVVGVRDNNGFLDTPTGGLVPGAWYSNVDRVKQNDALTYAFIDSTPAYSAATVNLTQATRTFIHSRRPGGRDIGIVYDRMDLGNSTSHAATGALPVILDSFFRGCVCPNEYVNNSPATSQEKSGSIYTFRKPKQAGAVYGGDAMLTMVVAHSNVQTAGDFLAPASGKFSADVVTYGNPTGITESFRVFFPASSVTDTPPTITPLTSTGYLGIRTGEASPRIVMLHQGLSTVTAMNFTVSYSGTADIKVDGLQPGTWSVTRDGVSLTTALSVGTNGVVEFSATSPGVGLFQLTQTGSAIPLDITDSSPLPSGAQGAVYSKTLNGTGGTAPYSWAVVSGALPGGTSLSTGGVLSGTPSVSGSYSFRVRVTDSTSATTEKDFILQIEASVTAVELTTSSLSACTVGVFCSQQLQATGGISPYTFLVASGTLPSGLVLDPDGTLSGTPTGSASVQLVTFRVRDSKSGTPQTDDQDLPLIVTSGTLNLSPIDGQITAGVLGSPYLYSFTREGGTPPFTWVMNGAPGLSIVDGQVIGTPTGVGDFNVFVQVTDDNGESVFANVTLPVRTSEKSIGLDVVAAGTSAIARVRAVGIDAADSCALIVVDSADQVIVIKPVEPGPAHRFVPITGLTPGTDYTAQTSCTGKGGSSKTFRPEIVTGTLPLPLKIPAYPGIDNVLVEYGMTLDLGTAVSASCGSDCNLTIPALTRGQIYYIRRRYRDAANAVIKESSVSMTLIQ